MSSKSERWSEILFTLMVILFIVVFLYTFSRIGFAFFEVPGGDWIVGIGTSILAMFTWILALTERNEGKENRELQALDEDLIKIYQPLITLFNKSKKEDDCIYLQKDEKIRLDNIFQIYSYRISDELITRWSEEVEGDKSLASKIFDPIKGSIYKINLNFQQLIEEQYKTKRDRYKELTSS